MHPVSLICPQCGAPLPRQALWRRVVCSYCMSEVTLSRNVVQAADFRQAWQRSRSEEHANTIDCGGERYRIQLTLGQGASARVMLAQRLGALREQVVIKLGQDAERLRQEAGVLEKLQALTSSGAAYFSQRLPQPIGCAITGEADGTRHPALLLRSPTGYWGSLADVRRYHPDGIQPCHAVWMWRRMLEVLAYLHDAGWGHGRLSPDHLLVHPGDHGILIIGWAEAGPHQPQARDLMQSAWTIRSLLSGLEDGAAAPAIKPSTPAPLASLLKRASEDSGWCAGMGASGIDQALQNAARAIFGAPRFIDFNPEKPR